MGKGRKRNRAAAKKKNLTQKANQAISQTNPDLMVEQAMNEEDGSTASLYDRIGHTD